MKFPLFTILTLSGLADASKRQSDRAVRSEFIRKMDIATGKKKNEENLMARLLRVAKPATPEYMQEPRVLEEYQDYAVNLTSYALKYIGCNNIHTYSDDLAQGDEADTVLEMNRFVVVRLCPTDQCSNYNNYGCNAGFGDYLIPMEDYLEIMAENYFAQFEEYCNTCYQCMYQANAQQDDGGDDDQNNGDDDGNADGDDAVNGDDGNNRRRLEEGDDYYAGADYYNDDGNNGDDAADAEDEDEDEEEEECEYTDVCENYRTACKDYNAEASNMQTFFQCSDYNIGNSDIYLGPHCRSDGKTIGIGLYQDEYCNEYNADLIDISSYTGMDLSDEYLKPYYSENCISCLASDGYELEQGDDEVNPVCGALYDVAAKCNTYMGNDGDINSDVQEGNEDRVCGFITNLIKNSYDEYGEIYLEGSGWQAYIPDAASLTTFQKYAMASSVILVVFLLAYSCWLHRVIRRSKYTWYPRRGYSSGPNKDTSLLGRMNSGIIQGRSRSGKGFEMRGGAYA